MITHVMLKRGRMSKWLMIFGLVLVGHTSLAQGVYIPHGFKGPLFFDISGRVLPSKDGARVYRIFREVGPADKKKDKVEIDESGHITTFKTPNLYFYFEDHFITGEIKTQGHVWVTAIHQESGLGLFSWKLHLKGECRWYHFNGNLSMVAVYEGEEWYGIQKEYDQDKKPTRVTHGKPWAEYNYSFEREVLKKKDFIYDESLEKSNLPAPQLRNAKADQNLIDAKPIDFVALMNDAPRFEVKNYRPFLGLYQGETINGSLKKKASANLEIVEFIEKKGSFIAEFYAFEGFEVQAKLTGSVNDNVLFARGDWMIGGEKMGYITLAIFLQQEEGKIEGFYSLRSFDLEAKAQSCSFKLIRESK